MLRLCSEARGLAFISCCTASRSVQPLHLLQLFASSPSPAVELPAACRKALPSTRTAAGLVLQQVTEEAPAPVSVRPKGATETGVARRPGSHAQRGFRAVPQRVKTRETTPLTSV